MLDSRAKAEYSIKLNSIDSNIDPIIRALQKWHYKEDDHPSNHLKLDLKHLKTLLLCAGYWRDNQSSSLSSFYEKMQEFYLLLTGRGLFYHTLNPAIYEFHPSVKNFRQQIYQWNISMWDSVLDKLQLVGDYPRDDHGLSRLKLEVKLIKIFFQCAMNINWKNQSTLLYSFSKFKSAIYEKTEQFYSLLLRLEDGLFYHELAEPISIFQESLKCYNRQIYELYTSMPDLLLQSNISPWLIRAFMEFMDFLLEGLEDIIILDEACDPKFEQLIEPLQEKLRFLKIFIRFATLGGSEPPGFTRFWNHGQVLAVNAARLCYIFWVFRADDQVFHELKSEDSALSRKIEPVNDQIYHNYTQTMMASRKYRSSFML